MDDIKINKILQVREETRAPILQCKRVLEENEWDIDKTVENIQYTGLDKVDHTANQKQEYNYPNNKDIIPEVFFKRKTVIDWIYFVRFIAIVLLIIGGYQSFISRNPIGVYWLIGGVIMVVISYIIKGANAKIFKDYDSFLQTEHGRLFNYFEEDRSSVVQSSIAKREADRIKKKENDKMLKNQKKSQQFAEKTIVLSHFKGLPISEGVSVQVFLNPGEITLKSGNMMFNLKTKNIIKVDFTTDTEIREQYVSSVGGAIGGAIIFGAIGAAIGGRAKKKNTSVSTSYLIITYINKEGNVEYIAFNNPGGTNTIEIINYTKHENIESNKPLIQEL